MRCVYVMLLKGVLLRQKGRHSNTQDSKEVMTGNVMSNPSEMGYRKRMYDMWCARNPKCNLAEQRLIAKTNRTN